jgi:uncharacterized protein (UPF0335 family)
MTDAVIDRHKALCERFPGLKEFFLEIDRREDEISGIRAEIGECFDSYCSSYATDKTALKLAYKLYKAINKDKARAEAMQFEYDKMADLLVSDVLPLEIVHEMDSKEAIV